MDICIFTSISKTTFYLRWNRLGTLDCPLGHPHCDKLSDTHYYHHCETLSLLSSLWDTVTTIITVRHRHYYQYCETMSLLSSLSDTVRHCHYYHHCQTLWDTVTTIITVRHSHYYHYCQTLSLLSILWTICHFFSYCFIFWFLKSWSFIAHD